MGTHYQNNNDLLSKLRIPLDESHRESLTQDIILPGREQYLSSLNKQTVSPVYIMIGRSGVGKTFLSNTLGECGFVQGARGFDRPKRSSDPESDFSGLTECNLLRQRWMGKNYGFPAPSLDQLNNNRGYLLMTADTDIVPSTIEALQTHFPLVPYVILTVDSLNEAIVDRLAKREQSYQGEFHDRIYLNSTLAPWQERQVIVCREIYGNSTRTLNATQNELQLYLPTQTDLTAFHVLEGVLPAFLGKAGSESRIRASAHANLLLTPIDIGNRKAAFVRSGVLTDPSALYVYDALNYPDKYTEFRKLGTQNTLFCQMPFDSLQSLLQGEFYSPNNDQFKLKESFFEIRLPLDPLVAFHSRRAICHNDVHLVKPPEVLLLEALIASNNLSHLNRALAIMICQPLDPILLQRMIEIQDCSPREKEMLKSISDSCSPWQTISNLNINDENLQRIILNRFIGADPLDLHLSNSPSVWKKVVFLDRILEGLKLIQDFSQVKQDGLQGRSTREIAGLDAINQAIGPLRNFIFYYSEFVLDRNDVSINRSVK